MAVLVWTLIQLIPVVLIVAILLKIFQLFKKKHDLQVAFKDFPGPPPNWLAGNMKELSGDYKGMLRIADYAAMYHGAFPCWMGPFDAFLITVHPTTVKYVLAGSDPKDEFSYALMRPWLGDGLLLASGKKWDRNRRMMTPAFHMDVLKNYVKIFKESTDVLMEKWRKDPGCHEAFHHMSLLTLDSMMKCLFGYSSDCQSETVRHPYIQGVYDVSEHIIKRIMNPLHHFEFIYSRSKNGKEFKKCCDIIHEHSQKLIEERRDVLKKGVDDSNKAPFLDILIQSKDSEGIGLSDQEIRDEVDTFMFEGHDSTASSLSWCLYNLAKHPEFQDKCREEIEQEWGNKQDLVWKDLSKLTYTNKCVKESMRLFPPVPNISRCAAKDIELPDGRVIPKGVRMAVSLFALHRNPEVWDNPEEYDPNRFAIENMKTSAGASWLPFSQGPRNCIGESFAVSQIMVVIPSIIRNFRLTLEPSKPAEPEAMLILRSKTGLYLNIHPI